MLFTLYSNSWKIRMGRTVSAANTCLPMVWLLNLRPRCGTSVSGPYLHAASFAIIPFIIQKCWYCIHNNNVRRIRARNCRRAAECVRVCGSGGGGGGELAKTTKWRLFGLLHFKFHFWIIYRLVYILVGHSECSGSETNGFEWKSCRHLWAIYSVKSK